MGNTLHKVACQFLLRWVFNCDKIELLHSIWILETIGGYPKTVEVLLEEIQVNEPIYDGATPLLIAAKKGNYKVVKVLLKKEGIEVNRADWAGDTPLSVAAHLRHGKIVDLLLGTDEIRAIGWNGWRPNATPA